MTARGGFTHLARRFLGSLSRRPPAPQDEAWAHTFLLPAETQLWRRMPVADRRHSIAVARRFEVLAGQPSREAMAAALLHDVGKSVSDLGTAMRVLATVVGPRGRRFTAYQQHEQIGADLLGAAGSAALTVSLVHGEGPPALAAALRAADDG